MTQLRDRSQLMEDGWYLIMNFGHEIQPEKLLNSTALMEMKNNEFIGEDIKPQLYSDDGNIKRRFVGPFFKKLPTAEEYFNSEETLVGDCTVSEELKDQQV